MFTRKKSNYNNSLYKQKKQKSAKRKMKNKGGVIRFLYKPPIINKPHTTIKITTKKELTPSPLRKVKNTLAKSRIARTLKKKIIMYKQVKISKLLLYDPTCAICFEDMKDINDITLTSCNHIFHTTCLEDWLSDTLSKNRCPKCNTIIRKTNSTNESGLRLSQIQQLRIDTQHFTPQIHNELITKLCDCQKLVWILKAKLNWTANNWPIVYASLYKNDTIIAEMNGWIDNIEMLIKKTIAIYSDVFPDFKHLFQVINNSPDLPFSITLQTIENQLENIVNRIENIYEDDEDLAKELNLSINNMYASYLEINNNEYLALFISIAERMIVEFFELL